MSRNLELNYYVLNENMTDDQLDNTQESKLVISEKDLFDLIKANYLELNLSEQDYIYPVNFYFTLKS